MLGWCQLARSISVEIFLCFVKRIIESCTPKIDGSQQIGRLAQWQRTRFRFTGITRSGGCVFESHIVRNFLHVFGMNFTNDIHHIVTHIRMIEIRRKFSRFSGLWLSPDASVFAVYYAGLRARPIAISL